MDKKLNFRIKILGLIFVFISIFYVFFASCSQRGLYLDGSVYFMKILDNISINHYQFFSDMNHTRFWINALQEFPFLIASLFIKSKITLATIYSFAQIGFPLLFLWWNFELTKRTKEYAILFWSVFFYAVVSLQYSIFSLVETIIGVPVYFLLFNYLFGKIHYTKLDKIGIAFLLLLMFGIYESTIVVGFLLFIGTFLAVYNEENPKDLLVKISIGAFSLFASAYTFFFVLLNKDEHSDFARFLIETVDFFQIVFSLSTGIFIITLVFLLFLLIKKEKAFSRVETFLMGIIYFSYFFRMINMPDLYLVPLWEQHTRSIVMWLLPLVLAGFIFYKIKYNKPQTQLIFNAFIPVFFAGIVLSAWQLVHTYYWNENIGYMKNELKNNNEILYFPEKHEELSNNFNKKLRRYIWFANYPSTALIFTKEYNVKKFLMTPEKDDCSNFSYRKNLYVVPERKLISLPYNNVISIKNKYWDLSECAKAIDKYNKDNNIPVNRPENPNKIQYP